MKVVFVTAKVMNFEQITTIIGVIPDTNKLYLSPQR